MPLMHPQAAERFNVLREVVKIRAGFDFLAKCGDICRASNFTSSKDGVANRSWHKTGRAFDYDQDCKNLIVVSEPRSGKQFFRTYLVCSRQDGSLGEKKTLKDYRGFTKTALVFDFTNAAEAIGWERIPAWSGWQKNYNRREFWHYQFDEGLTWDEAMLQLREKSRPTQERVFGRNDRGEEVRLIQRKLYIAGLLPLAEVDGVYGVKTFEAVRSFQKQNNLEVDGLIGPKTKRILFGN